MRKIIFSIIIVLMSTSSFADITLTNGRWSTTFNCAPWIQDYSTTSPQHYGSATEICDGLYNSGYGSQNTRDDSVVSHTSIDGNMTAGAGGLGFRQLLNPYTGGSAASSSGIANVYIPAHPTEIWVRWYLRYSKDIYWEYSGDPPGSSSTVIPGYAHEKLFYSISAPNGSSPNLYLGWADGDLAMYDQAHGTYYRSSGFNWMKFSGSKYGDGIWHCFEVHFKTDTNRANGEFDMWVDGVKYIHSTTVNYNGLGFGEWGFETNHKYNPTGGWLDMDDIAISTNGYIGPLTGGRIGILMPNPPGSVIIK